MTLWAGLGNYFVEGNSFVMYMAPFGIGWILSIFGSIAGANAGKKALV